MEATTFTLTQTSSKRIDVWGMLYKLFSSLIVFFRLLWTYRAIRITIRIVFFPLWSPIWLLANLLGLITEVIDANWKMYKPVIIGLFQIAFVCALSLFIAGLTFDLILGTQFIFPIFST